VEGEYWRTKIEWKFIRKSKFDQQNGVEIIGEEDDCIKVKSGSHCLFRTPHASKICASHTLWTKMSHRMISQKKSLKYCVSTNLRVQLIK